MNNATLVRETFQTRRQIEYFSLKELTLQCGHGPARWAEVVLGQLMDNGLDAPESSNTLPELTMTITDTAIIVADNGPGISTDVVRGVMDFDVRVSSKDKYISPTRGQQGNALKTVLAIPFVLSDGAPGPIIIESQGLRHTITVKLDHIAQEPRIELATVQIGDSANGPFFKKKQNPVAAMPGRASPVQIGTSVEVPFCLKNYAELEDDDERPLSTRFRELVEGYALFNPHATFTLTDGNQTHRFERTTDQIPKWRPDEPTDPHWYSPEQFRDLVAAYISAGKALFVRDFLALFRGLARTGTRAAILDGLSLDGQRLPDLVTDGGDLDQEQLTELLARMQDATRPVKPAALGVLGQAHLTAWLKASGCTFITYAKTQGVNAFGRPFVLETAFGYPRAAGGGRRVVTGINSAPTLVDPFRHLDDDGTSLAGLLGELHLDDAHPATVIVHLTAPSLSYTDRGKSSLAEMDDIGEALIKNTTKILKTWTTFQVRRIRSSNRATWRPPREKKESLKDICWRLMAAGYAKAAGSVLMAHARQIFYVVRALAQLGDGDKTLTSSYFTQTLLPDYVTAHPDETAGWDVLWDDRGHFTEPHTGKTIGIGTLSVRGYLAACDSSPSTELAIGQLSTAYPTHGPLNRFKNVLLIEKEGFQQIFVAAGIERRYDLAIMSSKGMNTSEARRLVELLPGVRFFVMHDFDKSGFSILGTLTRSTRRYRFKRQADIVDLGVRLADVQAEHLASEPVQYTKAPEANLCVNGATKKEVAWLLADGGRRVELNAFTNDHLIEWLERKLKAHGVEKFIPTDAVLSDAYRRALLIHTINRTIDRLVEAAALTSAQASVPKTLFRQVRQRLKADPLLSWDAAVAEIARTADDCRGAAPRRHSMDV